MTVTKLLHTRLRVNDLEQSVKFYEQALGLIATRRHTSPRGAQLVFLATPNSDEEIELCQMPAGAVPVVVQSDLMHLAFEVTDLMAFAAALKVKGYALSDGPTRTSSGSIIAFIDAPEGYEIELIQRARLIGAAGANLATTLRPVTLTVRARSRGRPWAPPVYFDAVSAEEGRPNLRSHEKRYCWARPALGPK